MKITYLDHMGSDLTVVNAARVSFNKQSDWELTQVLNSDGSIARGLMDKSLHAKDISLINYLAKHGHWTPFGHPQITVHVKAPIFVARQLFKHKVGLVENEVSRRYVSNPPEIYKPNEWRAKSENKKQGSSKETIDVWDTMVNVAFIDCVQIYEALIEQGVCPEQARMILPLATYTEWQWTGSLAAYARVYKLRTHEDAQKETQELVKQLDDIMPHLYPVSWAALNAS